MQVSELKDTGYGGLGFRDQNSYIIGFGIMGLGSRL